MVVGELETYGFVDAYNVTQRSTLTVWIEDYFLSRDRAASKYLEKCAWRLR